MAIEKASLIGGGDKSVAVSHRARKVSNIFGTADLGRHWRHYLSGIEHSGLRAEAHDVPPSLYIDSTSRVFRSCALSYLRYFSS